MGCGVRLSLQGEGGRGSEGDLQSSGDGGREGGQKGYFSVF